MAKLTAFVAVFAALIAVSAAYTTTTTTMVVTDDEIIINPRHEACQVEIQGMQRTQCLKYLATLKGQESEPSFLRRGVANPDQPTDLEECCDEMRSVSPRCRGDAVRHMMMEMREMWGKEEMQQMMMEKARAIPQKCNLRSSTTMM